MEEIGSSMGSFKPFNTPVEVSIRFCTRNDLAAIESLGLFRSKRELLYSTFEKQESNEAVMLVADIDGVPCGQAWLDLTRRGTDGVGYVWAVRVFSCLQNRGIGARLMKAAEGVLISRGLDHAELTVERRNVAAQRLYQRIGYHFAETGSPPAYVRLRIPNGQVLMRKTWLAGVPAGVGADANHFEPT